MIFNHKTAKWDKVINNANGTVTVKEKRKKCKEKRKSSLGILNSEKKSSKRSNGEKRTFQLLSSCYCNLSPSQVFRLQNQI